MNKAPHIKLLSFYTFLLSLVLVGGISCQKELSRELGGAGGGTGGSASFALVPTGNNCSDASVSGNFQAGVATSSNETMTVTVNVTKTGTWTFSTSQVNGFAFAGGGDFSATGNQVITLFATGKPTSAGNFDFNLNIGGATCKVSV